MIPYEDGELPHVRCGHCIHWHVRTDKSKCKRFLYPDTLIAARPWYSSDDTASGHCICSEFSPKPLWIDIYKRWTNIEEYAVQMRWEETNHKKMWVMLHGDRSIRYATTMGAFRHGNMIDQDGVFHYIEKMYYKMSRQSPTGYILVHEGGGSIALLEQRDEHITNNQDSQTKGCLLLCHERRTEHV